MKLPTCAVLCVDLLTCYYVDTIEHLFLSATNFTDFMDFGVFHELFSPKISGNSIVTAD